MAGNQLRDKRANFAEDFAPLLHEKLVFGVNAFR
jgi:hypothetical protein